MVKNKNMSLVDLSFSACQRCVGQTNQMRANDTKFLILLLIAFLDIKVSIDGNGLCTSMHYKPTDSHSYLLYSFSHVKNSIPLFLVS